MTKTTNNQFTIMSVNKIITFIPLRNLLKASFFILFTLFSVASIQAQEETEFNRNGRWLVETGYNIVSGITGGGTGVNYIVDSDGETLTSIGAEIGKFISQDFALKLRFGTLSSGGFSITNIGVGGKYYIGGKAPLDFGVSSFSAFGNSEIQGLLSIGYAMNLAPNITFEPSLGGIIADEGVLINFKIGFAMFL